MRFFDSMQQKTAAEPLLLPNSRKSNHWLYHLVYLRDTFSACERHLIYAKNFLHTITIASAMTSNGARPNIIHLMRLIIFASASFFGIRYDWTRLMMLIATTSISSTQPYGVMTSGMKSSGAIEYNTAIAIQSHAPACGETLFPLDKVSVLLVISLLFLV